MYTPSLEDLQTIADTCRHLYTGLRASCESVRHYREFIDVQIQWPAPAEQIEEARELYAIECRAADQWRGKVDRLKTLVRACLPDIWPELEILPEKMRGDSQDEKLDWGAARRELLKIEAAAAQVANEPIVSQTAAVERPSPRELADKRTESSTAIKQTAGKRGNKAKTEKAICIYVVERQAYYDSLRPRCQEHDAAAIKQAETTFGRNALLTKLKETGVSTSSGTISGSDAWTRIKADLCLGTTRDGLSKIRQSGSKVGFDIAEETAGKARGNAVSDEVIRKETLRLIETANMPQGTADQIRCQLTTGDIDDDEARVMLDSFREGEADRKRLRRKTSKSDR